MHDDQMMPGQILARGVCRHLLGHGFVSVQELVPAPGAAFEYRCHPGARRVRIRVEDVGPGDPEVGYPRCLAGRSFGPAESLDQESDVASFDINELNDQLDRYVRRRR